MVSKKALSFDEEKERIKKEKYKVRSCKSAEALLQWINRYGKILKFRIEHTKFQ